MVSVKNPEQDFSQKKKKNKKFLKQLYADVNSSKKFVLCHASTPH